MSNIPGPINIDWEKCSEVWVCQQQPTIHFNNLIYAQINVIPAYGPPMNEWTVADAKPWGVPGNDHPDGPAKALDLSGIIGTTHGAAQEIADLRLAFRTLGDTSAIKPDQFGYADQTESSLIGEGSRDPVDVTVFLIDGKFEWCWYVPVPIGPGTSTYLINIGPVKWYR